MISANKWTGVGSRYVLQKASYNSSVLAVPGSVRYASLSAIHRGIRRSERAQFPDSRSSERSEPWRNGRDQRYDQIGRTNKALEGAASARQQQKLRKKLDRKASEDDEDDEIGRQTRRKRFLDPEFSFGKRSLVYQLKHGTLKDTAASLDLQEPVRPRQFQRSDNPPRRNYRDEQPRRQSSNYQENRSPMRRDDAQPRRDYRDVQPRRQSSHYQERRLDMDREGNSSRRNYRDVEPYRHSSNYQERRSDMERDEDDSVDDAMARPRRRGMMPMTITYTTAASQFLYGRSVVKAALQQARRQLYKLYVYGGENRRDAKENDVMMNLAKARGVSVTIVPNEDQRLMDKMSMGRPHNGFVLETSPLPQLPVKALGKLEESPSKLGFNIELDHQTLEEKAVNGENQFVSKANNSTAKPFVLLLHEILDPGNLGALLRTASYMGIDAVGITSRQSSALTPVVLKSAAGAAEEVTIFTVDSPVEFLEKSKAAGWKTYAAVAPPETKLLKIHGDKFISTEDIDRTTPLEHHPCVLVLGNEGHGLPRSVKVAADFELSVPRFVQGSSVDSLNVSVAAGLLCHTFVKASSTKENSMSAQPETAIEPKKETTEYKGESLF